MLGKVKMTGPEEFLGEVSAVLCGGRFRYCGRNFREPISRKRPIT